MYDSKQPTMPQLSPRQPDEGTYPMFLNVEMEGISLSRENCGENRPSEFMDLKPPAETKLRHNNPEQYQRRVLSNKACNNAPLSPFPSQSQSESNTGSFKSPMPADTSSDGSDYTLSLPEASPRSKRVVNDVQREHSKRRRPSPRVNKSGGGVNLWGDTSSQASTDSEDDDFLSLFSSSPNVDRTKEYWALCYGKDNTMAVSPGQSWSAKRVAPAKGWYECCILQCNSVLYPVYLTFAMLFDNSL